MRTIKTKYNMHKLPANINRSRVVEWWSLLYDDESSGEPERWIAQQHIQYEDEPDEIDTYQFRYDTRDAAEGMMSSQPHQCMCCSHGVRKKKVKPFARLR